MPRRKATASIPFQDFFCAPTKVVLRVYSLEVLQLGLLTSSDDLDELPNVIWEVTVDQYCT